MYIALAIFRVSQRPTILRIGVRHVMSFYGGCEDVSNYILQVEPEIGDSFHVQCPLEGAGLLFFV